MSCPKRLRYLQLHLVVTSVLRFLIADIRPDYFLIQTHGRHKVPSCPEIFAHEIALPTAKLPRDLDHTLFDVAHHIRHRNTRSIPAEADSDRPGPLAQVIEASVATFALITPTASTHFFTTSVVDLDLTTEGTASFLQPANYRSVSWQLSSLISLWIVIVMDVSELSYYLCNTSFHLYQTIYINKIILIN